MALRAEHTRNAGAGDVTIQDANPQSLPAERDSQQACDKRFANAAFAAHDGDDLFDSAIFTGRSHCQWYATPTRGLLGCDRNGLSLDDGVVGYEQKRLFFGRKAMRASTTCHPFPFADPHGSPRHPLTIIALHLF